MIRFMDRHTRFWIAKFLGTILTLVGVLLFVRKSPTGVFSAIGIVVTFSGVLLLAGRVR